MSGYGVNHAIITLGKAGAVCATRDRESGYVPAQENVNVRDTTGAGYVDFLSGIASRTRSSCITVEIPSWEHMPWSLSGGNERGYGKGVWKILKDYVDFASKAAAHTIDRLH